MKLRPRLTLFTVLLVILVVAFTSLSTILSLRYLLNKEMQTNQATLFNNFREACFDSLYLGDDLGIQVYSESLEKSVPGLAYAVFVDKKRGGIQLGGIESLERFQRLEPTCEPNLNREPDIKFNTSDVTRNSQKWRIYCQDTEIANIRGERIWGTLFLGFNLEFLEIELEAIIKRMWRTLAWSMLIVLLFGLSMAYILAGRLTQPIQHLTEGAKAIGDGRLETQIPIESTDELGFLAQEFNLMANKLKELDQLKDDFISSVSHELRSPLAAISGYIELLQSKPLDEISEEKRAKALRIIQQSTDRLAHFINEILDLAKLKSGQSPLRKKQLNIKDLADDLMGLFQPLLDKKKIDGDIVISPDVKRVEADIDKIRQVLTNLFSNALKFTPSGGKIRILAKNHNEFVKISVQDSGVGVPASELEHIFEKFKQLEGDNDPGAGQKGTGLGLAIAREIVENHGGKIWMESNKGEGTTVHFTLPV